MGKKLQAYEIPKLIIYVMLLHVKKVLYWILLNHVL